MALHTMHGASSFPSRPLMQRQNSRSSSFGSGGGGGGGRRRHLRTPHSSPLWQHTSSHSHSHSHLSSVAQAPRSHSLSAPVTSRDVLHQNDADYVSDYSICASFIHTTLIKNPPARLVVFPLRLDDVEPTAQILCRAFAGGPYGKPVTFVRKYLMEQTGTMPMSTTLTAWLVPDSFEENVNPDDVNAESGCELVGMADVSIDNRSRADFEETGVEVPGHATYLSNVAVTDKQRRRGIGAALVEAAEELGLELGYGQMALHVRQGDIPATSLYESIGYSTVAVEKGGMMINKVPRVLMMHSLDLLGGLE
ncbi:N-acetyltransferase domain-containing protein [Pseudoscourfieldia marina]